jgi:hypothetical protein
MTIEKCQVYNICVVFSYKGNVRLSQHADNFGTTQAYPADSYCVMIQLELEHNNSDNDALQQEFYYLTTVCILITARLLICF